MALGFSLYLINCKELYSEINKLSCSLHGMCFNIKFNYNRKTEKGSTAVSTRSATKTMEAAATTMITLRATDAANLDKEGVVLSFKTADALPSKSSPVLKKLERHEGWNILHPKVEAQEKLATLCYVGGYLPATAPVRIQHRKRFTLWFFLYPT